MTVTTKLGYCPDCMQNVLHERQITSPFFAALDAITFRSTLWFGLGNWYCCQCSKHTYALRPLRRGVPTNRFVDQESKHDAVRNFIRSDHSLLLHRQRSARFSQKFRDGIVLRLTSGTSNISQLCRELQVSESDLVGWIADLLHRKQDEIDNLRKVVNCATGAMAATEKIEHKPASEIGKDDLIEGHFSPIVGD